SRPYRLVGPIHTDVDAVRRALRSGSYTRAIDLYRGPLLPSSQAPAVAELRRDLHSDVRAALLTSGDPDALLRLADTQHGRLDLELWQTALAWLAPGSPRHAQVRAHVALLAEELR
ncbi:MAG: transcriptional regulator, partial [Actinomycetota bacterium]|nr:transcriptional regulator [Actinomycetota bacterium]